ncbi:MAG: UDP-N-acetylmuramoyl-L-alanine--D-glutamate ligase [Candidatus Saccharimonadales bacterium]
MSKKVAIAGFGSEGLSAYRYFKAQGADITIFDEKKQPNQPVPEGAEFVWGKDCFADLRGFDVVMRFPALRPDRITTDGEMSSVIKEFFKACPAPIIGVTGSKGKGTTSSLIHLMLNNAGKTTHIAGNIGVPALDILPDIKKDDVVVLELSSFQLWDLQQSPHVAVVLMIEPDHLDVHKDLIEYIGAKSNIVRWQTADDVTVYLPGNHLTEQIAMQGKGKKTPYTKAPGAHVEDGFIVIDEHKICAISDIALPGKHNVDNACAAVTAAWQFTQDADALAKALREFKGLDHRLKLVRELNDVRFYDDSIATTPGSAIAALHAFPEPKVLILGGSDKGADFTELAETIVESDLRAVVLIGAMRHKLHEAITAAGYKGPVEFFDEHSTMEQIVTRAAKQAKSGDVVILSPACASFDMFKDYKDRGEQFIAAVGRL